MLTKRVGKMVDGRAVVFDVEVKELKLFVWPNSLRDYSTGVMFALAVDVTEARRMVKNNCNYVSAGELVVPPTVYDKPCGFAVWGGD